MFSTIKAFVDQPLYKLLFILTFGFLVVYVLYVRQSLDFYSPRPTNLRMNGLFKTYHDGRNRHSLNSSHLLHWSLPWHWIQHRTLLRRIQREVGVGESVYAVKLENGIFVYEVYIYNQELFRRILLHQLSHLLGRGKINMALKHMERKNITVGSFDLTSDTFSKGLTGVSFYYVQGNPQDTEFSLYKEEMDKDGNIALKSRYVLYKVDTMRDKIQTMLRTVPSYTHYDWVDDTDTMCFKRKENIFAVYHCGIKYNSFVKFLKLWNEYLYERVLSHKEQLKHLRFEAVIEYRNNFPVKYGLLGTF